MVHIHSDIKRGLCLLLLSLSVVTPGISQANDTLSVFACEPEWAALVKQLGGDRVDVYSATTAKQDPHHVQARPSLIAKARRADLLVCSGAELEIGWLPLLLRKSGNSRIISDDGQFFAADYVDKLEIPKELDRRHGDVHAEGNPHVHTSPVNILIIAEQLSEKLATIDSENAAHYRSTFSTFDDDWGEAMKRWETRLSVLDGTRVVTHHRFWSYLNAWLGIELVATLEPVPGVSPSSSYLAGLIKTVEREGPAFIMYVDYVSDRPAEWLSERTGLQAIPLPASVNFQGDETLIQWFDALADMLEEAVSKERDNTSG
jgi:zinc/manganese transport system substrate-binding protein